MFTLLHNVVQGDKESMRQYMAQFSKATSNILDLHSVVAMHALQIGFHLGKFLDTLYANSPTNMDELRSRVARYINIEENFDTRRKIMKTSKVATSEK